VSAGKGKGLCGRLSQRPLGRGISGWVLKRRTGLEQKRTKKMLRSMRDILGPGGGEAVRPFIRLCVCLWLSGVLGWKKLTLVVSFSFKMILFYNTHCFENCQKLAMMIMIH
jgi:hypothetical protein